MASVTKNSDRNDAMADEDLPSGQEDIRPEETRPAKESKKGGGTPDYRAPRDDRAARSERSAGFFTIYKRGQGYWTRMGTVFGAALIAALACQFLYSELVLRPHHIGLIVCVAFLVVFTAFSFYVMNKPQNVDFLIATDSEMKKVNWTTKEELIGSTKVVILFMFVIAVFLFTFDIIFGYFFYLIHVLKTPPF